MTWLFTFCSKIEVAYQEAVALKRQEELIREEEASWLAETELKAKKASDKEKKSKKKQVLSLHMIMVFDYTVKISEIFFIYNLREHLFKWGYRSLFLKKAPAALVLEFESLLSAI